MAKKKDAKTVEKNSDGKPQDKLLISNLTSAIIIALIVTIGFVYLALIERPAINASTINTQVETMANSQASILDQALNQLRQRLTNIALNDELLKALDKKDKATIERFEQEVARAFPEAASARIITLNPLGIASIDPKAIGLRNNIEVDLLRSVSNGDTVEPEAYKADGKWLFSLAEPVKDMDKKYASAALFVTLDETYIRVLLGQLDNSLGDTTLIQQFGNKQNVIASTGQSATGTAINVDTTISHWKITFSPSAELVATSSHSPLMIWIFFGVALLAVLGATAFNYSSVKKLITGDVSNLRKLRSSEQYALPGFAALAEFMQAELTAANEAATSVAIASATAEIQELETPLTEEELTEEVEAPPAVELPADIPETIFRAYDIRGLADQELTDDNVFAIGLAIGSEALDQGQQTIVVAADGRHSSPRIRDAMIKGLQASGRDVIDIGTTPTPLMYFATHQLGTQSGVMITGSHNPAEYNGIKIVIGGRALSGQAISSLHNRIRNKDLAAGQGDLQNRDIEQEYIDYIINDVAIAQPLKVVIDAGNGVAGAIAPRLFEELGCEIIPIYCEIDGNFPNHHPDPTVEENLADLKKAVQEHEADLGIAFDGDGDRLGVVTASGQSVAADRLLMLLAQDVVSRNPGADVLFDVKCTRNLNSLISNFGGRPIMWKTGHSFMKDKMAETGALLGGEFSGHIFFKERWFGFDDGMYAAARLIEILSTSDPDLDLQLEAFPNTVSSPELKVETDEEQKFAIIEQLVNTGQFGDGKVSTLDGIRVDFPDGWGLVRASNTTPMLILRFEADTEEALSRIQEQFKEQLNGIDNSLQYSF